MDAETLQAIRARADACTTGRLTALASRTAINSYELRRKIMTFEELLAEGQRKLEERRQQRAAEEAAAKAEAERKAADLYTLVCTGIASCIPAPLWPYLQYEVDGIARWSYDVRILAPNCAPIAFCYLKDGRLNGDSPFTVPGVLHGGMDDYGEGYEPEYDFSRGEAHFADIAIALAAARERREDFEEAQRAFQVRAAEVERLMAERKCNSIPDASETAVPAAYEPSIADQLAALIRTIVQEELGYHGA